MSRILRAGRGAVRPVSRRVLFAAGLLLLAAFAAEAVTLTMPLAQVKPGMKGRGRSVFQGQSIEEFEAEILGVLENVQPKRNVILARLKRPGTRVDRRHQRHERQPHLHRRQAHRRRGLQLQLPEGGHCRDHADRGDAGHREGP